MIYQNNKQAGSLILIMVQAVLVGLAGALAVLCLCAQLLVMVDLPDAATFWLSCLAIDLCAFLSGLMLAYRIARGGILCGLSSGIFWCVCFFAATFACDHAAFGSPVVAKAAGLLLCGLLGGCCGILLTERPKQAHRKGK